MNAPCENAKNDINQRIQGTSVSHVESCLEQIESEESDDRFVFDEMIDSNETNEMNILSWINDIVKEATGVVQAEDDGDRDNLMENRPFAEYFIKLCHMLPIWSAICCKFFNCPNLIGSSWSSETGFKNTKQLHGDKLPCSVDEFVKCDLEFNNSTVVDASKKYLTNTVPNSKSSKPKKSSSTQIEKTSSYENTNENDDSQFDTACSVGVLDENDENVGPQIDVVCPVCADGNMPTGAHKCFSCDKPVHVLVECSISIGAEEGYGEIRHCISCHRSSANKQIDQSETAKALNAQEIWARKKSSQKGKYLKSKPNYGQVPVNKKVAISLLMNENRLKTVYTINKKKIVLSNTCAIDSVIQLIAAAYAYHSAYRLSLAMISNKKDDGILHIAIMLATGYLL